MNRIVEMIIDENMELGVFAISVVENPAIEEDFIFMSAVEGKETVKMATVDEEQRILMGAVLIPNLQIYRLDEQGQPYHIWFSEETVKEVSHRYLLKGNQGEATLEHEVDVEGLSVVESWIIEDVEFDKSRKYGLDHPEGTWMVKMKVNNDEIWNEYVKTGKVKGFSIEGKFSRNVEMSRNTDLSKIPTEDLMASLYELFKQQGLIE